MGVEGKDLSSTNSGGPIGKLVAVSGESGQWQDQHSNGDKEEKVNLETAWRQTPPNIGMWEIRKREWV